MDWWESFYREADYDRCAYLAGDATPDLLERFVDRVAADGGDGPPIDDLLSVGCGPAVALTAFADRHPDVDCLGVDVSEVVVADNRERAADRGLDNLAFEVDALPDLALDREFDVVYCMAVLYFVADAERALRSLYERVRPGGYLVVNYPNRYTRARADREFEGRKREAFRLVIEGENLLSYDRIREVLGRGPRNYWSAVGADDREDLDRATPAVYVRKPAE